MLFGALYKLKVMHGQQTYSVCVGVAVCVCVCVCVGVTMYIYKCIYVCVSLDCVWDMKRKQSNAPVSLPSGFSLSLGRDFCTSGGDPWLVFLLGNFWASQPVRQSLIKSTLQPQSATTCHNMLCLSFVTLTLSRWVCWTSELVWLTLWTMLTW